MRPGPEADLFAHFNARLRPSLSVREIAEASGSAGEIKRREGAAVLAAVPPNGFVVALDHGGRTVDSVVFATLLQGWIEAARPVCFVIGGAEGLDAGVILRAGYVLSLGAMTWPHFLVRGMLAEQVFRARAIASGHPYHRAGRPEG